MLGHIQVDAERLMATGTDLRSLLAPFGAGISADPSAGELPTQGWRQLSVDEPEDSEIRSAVYAAPHADVADGWVLINLARVDGQWIFSADPEPVAVRPGDADRRRGLALRWPQQLEAGRSGLGELPIELRNTLDVPWSADPQDTAHIQAWVLDQDGRPIGSNWFAYGFHRPFPDLAARQVVTLPATLEQLDYTSLPPGKYELRAVAAAFNLAARPGWLHLL